MEHNFIKTNFFRGHTLNDFLECENCKLLIYLDAHCIAIIAIYNKIGNLQMNPMLDPYSISCDEVIIKNIIE